MTPFVAVACCGLGNFTPDDNLLVRVEAPLEESLDPDAPADEEVAVSPETLCGAQVVAIGNTDGDEIPLTEEVVDGRCRYRGQVDPAEEYTVKATHPDYPQHVGLNSWLSSNPACNQATAPDDSDGTLLLQWRESGGAEGEGEGEGQVG